MGGFHVVDSMLNSSVPRKSNGIFYYLPSAVTQCGHLIFCVRSRLPRTSTLSWITRRGGRYGTCLNPVLMMAECWKLIWNGGLPKLCARFVGVTLRDLHTGTPLFECTGYYLSIVQHSDVKPHNFVLTSSFHLRLIDFGSAAPLSPPEPDGSQNIPQRHSLVPCGTCDYISPEILQAHEDALLALELSGQSPASPGSEPPASTCGLETDWWSLGVMLYELVYGVAPFFANDIRTTYLRIMNHEVCSLPFIIIVMILDTTRLACGSTSPSKFQNTVETCYNGKRLSWISR